MAGRVKRRSRAQRQERHAARVERVERRQADRHRGRMLSAYLGEAYRLYRSAILQGRICEVMEAQGLDPYREAVVCDRCGQIQLYVSDELNEDVDRIAPCEDYLEIGCTGETCITVARYLEEAA